MERLFSTSKTSKESIKIIPAFFKAIDKNFIFRTVAFALFIAPFYHEDYGVPIVAGICLGIAYEFLKMIAQMIYYFYESAVDAWKNRKNKNKEETITP